MTRQEIYAEVTGLGNNMTKDDLINGLTEISDSEHTIVLIGDNLIVDDKWYESAEDHEEVYSDLDYVMYNGTLWVEE